MMTDTPAVVLLCLAAVLKCVCSLPVTSIFMLSPKISSVTQGCERMSCAVYRASALTCSIFPISSLAESLMLSQYGLGKSSRPCRICSNRSSCRLLSLLKGGNPQSRMYVMTPAAQISTFRP